MTRKNCLDRNRIDAMIQAALEQDAALMLKLEEMANRFAEPCDALAAFLIGDIGEPINFIDVEYDEDYLTVPCTAAQWDFFMSRCREVTETADMKISLRDQEALARYARIGQWPDRIPLHGDEPWATPFYGCGWEAAWAWAWLQDEKEATRFVQKGWMPIFRPAWASSSWVVGAGLIEAIRAGLIEVSEEQRVPFAAAYARWYANAHASNADPKTLCYHGLGLRDGRLRELSEEELQALACFYDNAARELARRGIPLAIPLMQNLLEWVWAMEKLVPTGEIEEDAERFRSSDNTLERYALWRAHCEERVRGPDDSFGPEVQRFWLLVGRDYDGREPKRSTYEDALDYLIRRVQ